MLDSAGLKQARIPPHGTGVSRGAHLVTGEKISRSVIFSIFGRSVSSEAFVVIYTKPLIALFQNRRALMK